MINNDFVINSAIISILSAVEIRVYCVLDPPLAMNCSLNATVSSDSSECGEGEMAGDIPNGMLCYTGLTPGSTATYSCHDDYWLNGSSVLECQNNGTWNATAPHCVMLGKL